MIVEGIVTTRNLDGTTNVAPMGPTIDDAGATIDRLVLRPFQSSRTFANLIDRREGVFHITDDVLVLAEATIGAAAPKLVRGERIDGWRLADCCRYFEFRLTEVEDQSPRAEMTAAIVAQGEIRPFLGFNRARHAVVEAAILASRVALLERDWIDQEFRRLAVLVDKTGGEREHRAFTLLSEYVRRGWEIP